MGDKGKRDKDEFRYISEKLKDDSKLRYIQ